MLQNPEFDNHRFQNRRIVHVDMDAFYAAIEELDFPELRDHAVIVGANPRNGMGRGVVSTCNYIARKFGIHSAMPVSQAWKLCPKGKFQAPRFRRYSQISKQIMQIFQNFSPQIEPVSIDEAYLDCTGTDRIFKTDLELAQTIQNQIKNQTGLVASVGIAPNKYIAKIASDLNKPNGIAICNSGPEQQFLHPLPVKRLWGAGKNTISKLHQAGYYTIGQIAKSNEDELKKILGNRTAKLSDLACGIDNRSVVIGWQRKSLSEEITFEKDISNTEYLEVCLSTIADQLGQKLRKENFQFKCIQLKLRYSNFKTCTRNITLFEYSDLSKMIRENAIQLFNKAYIKGQKVRLIGIGLSHLLNDSSKDIQLPLFSAEMIAPGLVVQKKRDQLIDAINNNHKCRLTSATSLKR